MTDNLSDLARRARTTRHTTATAQYRAAAVIALDDGFPGDAAIFAQLAISAATEAAAARYPVAPGDDE